MQLRTAVLVCNKTSRRFENNNIQRTSLAREIASLASGVPFSLKIWNCMGVNKTSYATYPTQIYTFQLNVWYLG
jgi:hypothetical protein